MKKLLVNLMILLASMSLVACSTNTQKENTGVGVVSGAVIGGLAGSLVGGGVGKAVAVGVGIVAGALVGGYIGHNMDHSDSMKMDSAMNNPTNQSSTWTNSKTGATYTVKPTSKKMTVNGNSNCRKYYTKAMMNGKQQVVHGVACMQSNGTWAAVNS